MPIPGAVQMQDSGEQINPKITQTLQTNSINSSTKNPKASSGIPTRVNRLLNNIYNNPKYKALSEDKQKEVRGRLYDKIMAPYYKKIGADTKSVPSKEAWVTSHYKKPTTDLNPLVAASVTKGGLEVAKGALKVDKYIADTVHSAFAGPGYYHSPSKVQDWLQNKIDNTDYLINRADEFIGDNYNKTLMQKAVSFGGEMFGNLPAFETAGGLVGKALPAVKGAPIAYRLIRGAAQGYIDAVSIGKSGEEAQGWAVGGGILAGGGKVAEKLGDSDTFKAAKSFLGRLVGIGGPRALQKVLERANGNVEAGLKEAAASGERTAATAKNPIIRASLDILNRQAKSIFKKDYRFLGAKERQQVIQGVVGIAKASVPEVAAVNKDIVASTVKQSIQAQAAVSPLFKETQQLFAKHGIDLAEENTEATVENAAVKSGRKSVDKVSRKIDQQYSGIEKRTNVQKRQDLQDTLNLLKKDYAAAGSLEEKETIKKLINQHLSIARGLEPIQEVIKDISQPEMAAAPGAASAMDPAFRINKLVQGPLTLESKQHQLVQVFSHIKDFPKTTQEHIMAEMKNAFPDVKVKDYPEMVRRLDEHVSNVMELIKTKDPDVIKGGEKVFRSTEIRPGHPPSDYQKQISEKAKEARLLNTLKNHPKAKAAAKMVLSFDERLKLALEASKKLGAK